MFESLLVHAVSFELIERVRFRDMFPTTLSALDYDQSATDIDYLKASATFEYQLYEIIKL